MQYLLERRCARYAMFALAAMCAGSAWAALYKWTDAQGHVVYSDQPPAGTTKSEQLQVAPPPANPNAAKELAQREIDFRKRRADQADALAKSEKARASAGQRNEACLQAKGQLRQLAEDQVAIYRYNDKGEREAMDAGARARASAKLNAYLRDNQCPA